MNVFHCAHCQHLLFFENVRCVRCGHPLAYLPDLKVIRSLEPAGGDLWYSPLPQAAGRVYRLVVPRRRLAAATLLSWSSSISFAPSIILSSAGPRSRSRVSSSSRSAARMA